jgi:ribose transport system ATP-binding protein
VDDRDGRRQAEATAAPAIEASGISKSFGGVRALRDAAFSASFGEIHALVGENGAGKSTLIKILCGVLRPDEGSIRVRGEEVALSGPAEAQGKGIGTVFQELTLMPSMTVAENLLLRDPPTGKARLIRRRHLAGRAEEIFAEFGVEGIDPLDLASSLSVADRQVIEIIRTLRRQPDVLFLDEPTAALAEREVAWLFENVRRRRDDGACVIFTSHRWREVEDIADRITVFRNGEQVATRPQISESEAVTLMTGRTIDRAYPEPPALDEAAPPVLEVKGLSADGVRDVSLTLRRGEILGIGGLAGQGQRQLFMTLFGARKSTGGEVIVGGRARRLRKPSDAIRAGMGIALVPEDRKAEGLLLPMSVRDNLTLAILDKVSDAGVLRPGAENRRTREMVERLDIRTNRPSVQEAGTLSGGNQQKVLIGRWLATGAEVLLLYDITRGVDAATKRDIYQLMMELAGEGKALLFYSSETEEMAHLCHRVLVMREGALAAELAGPSADAETIVAAALTEHSGV